MPSRHAVVDGSNIATEGRTEPSLEQLDEAVRAFTDEHEFTHITVIVDATFEHRVSTKERKAARKAIDDGDIITPPAGVIGRGDAFILQVADKAGAVVLSNDSFQEFHGTYQWLFDEGRLIGGKPIPGVGWIYVARSPVRGPVSRRATSATKRPAATPAKKTTKKATAKRTPSSPATPKREATVRASAKKAPVAASADGSNPAEGWEQFTHDYPIGSTIAAAVAQFSSHGAYALVDGLSIYLPNRLLGDPAPQKARDVIDIGETRDFIVHRFDPERYGIDAGLIPAPGAKTTRKRAAKKPAAKKTTAKKPAARRPTAKKRAPAKKTAAKKPTAKKAAAKKPALKKEAPAKKRARRPATKRTAAR